MEYFTVLVVFCIFYLDKTGEACPRMCACDNYGAKHSIDCDSQDLDSFPPGMPEWTTEFSFDGNYLTTLDLTAFTTTEYFEKLSVRYNQITKINLSNVTNKLPGMRGSCNYATAIFPRLKEVNLRGNMLAKLPKCLLLSWPVIEILKLNENGVLRLADLNFALYKTRGGSLKELWLRGNLIQSLLREDWFAPENEIKNLELLDLGENQVETMKSATFLFLPELLTLKLDGNRLSHIPGFAFITTGKKLKEIYLSSNQITSIGENAFAGLPALKRLDLSQNMIQCLMPQSFTSCRPTVVVANSSENTWSENLRQRFETNLGALNYLAISENPWLCDCDLKPMLQNVTTRRLMPQLRYERCNAPARFSRRYISAAISQLTECE